MSFQTDWTWLTVVVAILVIAWVIFLDFRFQLARRRLLRITCWLIAVGALLFMYLRPNILVPAQKETAVIFTEPFTETERDSILQKGNLIEITSLSALSEVPYSIDEVQVHGDGLHPWQLETLQGYSITWHAAPLEEGITAIQVPNITEGVPFELSGDIMVQEALNLTLINPEGNAQTKKLSAEEVQFQFSSSAKTTGLFQYQIVATRNKDTVFSETLPVQVAPSRKANLLLLGSFPSFEWNYLKNHLSDLGFGLASRFQLSQETFHTEFLNMPRTDVSNLNKKALKQYKLVIMDGSTFEGLGNRERKAIFEAVELAEVGLFLMIDEVTVLEKITSVNLVQGDGEALISTAEKQILLLKMPFSVTDGPWNQVSFQEQEVGAFTQRGIGKIGFSLVANSHVLELQGAPEVYAQLWDELLSPIIGFEITDNPFYLPQFHFVDHQSDIAFSYFGQPEISIDGESVPPINSPIRPDFWRVNYWPKKQGWHSIQAEGNDQGHFFVHAPQDWKALQRFEKQAYNRHFFATNEYERRKAKQIEKPLSLWIPFGMFLLAITGLWLERKLS